MSQMRIPSPPLRRAGTNEAAGRQATRGRVQHNMGISVVIKHSSLPALPRTAHIRNSILLLKPLPAKTHRRPHLGALGRVPRGLVITLAGAREGHAAALLGGDAQEPQRPDSEAAVERRVSLEDRVRAFPCVLST
jgi:hypothetical protein